MISLVWYFPLVMALAALINGVGCRKLGKLAGMISVLAMASTFVMAVGIFFQVRSAAHGAHEGAEHPTEHVEAGESAMLAKWNGLSEEGKAAMTAEYVFVMADPDHPMPWDTTLRGGLGGNVTLWNWIDIPKSSPTGRDLKIDLAFHVDQLTSIFLLFISFVGSLVFIYATGYMVENHDGHEVVDPGYARFFSYLALFAASMYTLILGANFVVMFIGWEGVGLCSYLLIGYYYDRRFSDKLTCADAGKKAFVVNRVGDFGLMIGMFLIFWGLGTMDFQQVISILSSGDAPAGFGYTGAIITAATLLLFLGATGKSAQIPLFIWLPDAMAGPTPVSALIHAATMVTAGVYMLARLNVLFMLSPVTLVVIAVIGALTAFVAASIGMTQRGIKKILAYSTVSQLGYMFLAMGVGSFASGIFHVFTHAFFKACLFLAAGSIIHALHHEEDVFKMGGLRKKMPLTWLAYLSATLAIAGIVPWAGFFSKDEILYNVYTAAQGDSLPMDFAGLHFSLYHVLWISGLITAAMTAFYMGRSLVLAFHGETRMPLHATPHQTAHGADHDHADSEGAHDAHADHDAHHAVAFNDVHESPLSLTGVLLVLGVCSLIVGFLNVPSGILPLGDYNNAFHHFIAPVTDRGAELIAHDIYGQTAEHAPAGALVVGNVVDEKLALNVEYEGPERLLALLSVLIGAGGIGLAFFIYGSGKLDRARALAHLPFLSNLWNISWNAWKWDDLYDELFVNGAMRLYRGVLWFDKSIIDGVFVLGTANVCRKIGIEFRRLQNGQVQVYGLVMFLGVCLFLMYFVLSMGRFLSEVPPPVVRRPTHAQVMHPAAPSTVALEVHAQ
ncbi:NADH-quinone oxidoreductase subunit L [soil metagenome]